MRYVRYALFDNLFEARAAVEDIQTQTLDVPNDEVVLTLHHQKPIEEDLGPSESDGSRGLLIGLTTGAIGGFLLALLLAKLAILPLTFIHAALFGIFVGSLIGGLGGGLYGTGLTAEPLKRLEKLWRRGNVLLTAEVEGAQRILEIERLMKKHHAVVASG